MCDDLAIYFLIIFRGKVNTALALYDVSTLNILITNNVNRIFTGINIRVGLTRASLFRYIFVPSRNSIERSRISRLNNFAQGRRR